MSEICDVITSKEKQKEKNACKHKEFKASCQLHQIFLFFSWTSDLFNRSLADVPDEGLAFVKFVRIKMAFEGEEKRVRVEKGLDLANLQLTNCCGDCACKLDHFTFPAFSRKTG